MTILGRRLYYTGSTDTFTEIVTTPNVLSDEINDIEKKYNTYKCTCSAFLTLTKGTNMVYIRVR